jgi:hypothetical protein
MTANNITPGLSLLAGALAIAARANSSRALDGVQVDPVLAESETDDLVPSSHARMHAPVTPLPAAPSIDALASAAAGPRDTTWGPLSPSSAAAEAGGSPTATASVADTTSSDAPPTATGDVVTTAAFSGGATLDSGSSGDDAVASGTGGYVDAYVASTTSVSFSGQAVSGRVTTIEPFDMDRVASVRILEMPSHGNLTINPDNTLALVMTSSNYTGPMSFRCEVTLHNGSVREVDGTLDVTKGPQEAGWGDGSFYMLKTDENDDIIVEHGANHREIYISKSADALSKADIAALEGVGVSDIDGKWLADHPEYGSSPEMALKPDAGMALWGETTGTGAKPSSNWLLFENGYKYDVGQVIDAGSQGESELHPLHITSYGSGRTAVITSNLTAYNEPSQNIVFSNLDFTGGITVLRGEDLMFHDISVSEKLFTAQWGIDRLTIRNSDITNVITEARGDTYNGEYVSGLYVENTHHLLLEGNYFWHNGWQDGYETDPKLMPPIMFSHNVYLQYDTTDVTFRDNISAQGASFGAHIRGGGFLEDNVFLDNNAQVDVLNGMYRDYGPVGNYSLLADNLFTSAGYKLAPEIGGVSIGYSVSGYMNALVDNIVAHMADPNNPGELAEKAVMNWATGTFTPPVYDNTIVYNWAGSSDYSKILEETNQNIAGLNTDILDQTTIQKFAATLLGKENATIDNLAAYLRAISDTPLENVVDADLIIRFFQDGFGLTPDIRAADATLRFVPDDRGDGIRWDNRLNWSTGDLPGTQDHDSVDLHGNWVNYGGTTRLENLDFGDSGKLTVAQGYLGVRDEIAVEGKGHLTIDGAGQFWTDGFSDKDKLVIDVEGGRFANTGIFKGPVNMTVSDNGQAILATDNGSFDLNRNSRLEIVGRDALVGFDGENGDIGLLRLSDNSTLKFTADDGRLGRIREFESGRFGDDRPYGAMRSGADLGDARLEIDITGMRGQAVSKVLMRVDELIGRFDEFKVIGLGSSRDATVVINYESDTVTLRLGVEGDGTGSTEIKTTHDRMEEPEGRAGQRLWEALTADHGVLADDPMSTDRDDDDDQGDPLL